MHGEHNSHNGSAIEAVDGYARDLAEKVSEEIYGNEGLKVMVAKLAVEQRWQGRILMLAFLVELMRFAHQLWWGGGA